MADHSNLAMLMASPGGGSPNNISPSAGMQNPNAIAQLLMQLRLRGMGGRPIVGAPGAAGALPPVGATGGIGSLQAALPTALPYGR